MDANALRAAARQLEDLRGNWPGPKTSGERFDRLVAMSRTSKFDRAAADNDTYAAWLLDADAFVRVRERMAFLQRQAIQPWWRVQGLPKHVYKEQKGESYTSPHLVFLHDGLPASVRVLLGGADHCIMKRQRLFGQKAIAAEAGIALIQEAVIAFALRNLLLEEGPSVPTVHVVWIVDAFVDTAFGKGEVRGEFYAAAIYELAGTDLIDHVDRNSDLFETSDHLATLFFGIHYTLTVLHLLRAFYHRDLHTGNVFVRDVSGTVYANRDWVYQIPGSPPSFVVVPAAMHNNFLVELIDFDRSAMRPTRPTQDELDVWDEKVGGVRDDLQALVLGRHRGFSEHSPLNLLALLGDRPYTELIRNYGVPRRATFDWVDNELYRGFQRGGELPAGGLVVGFMPVDDVMDVDTVSSSPEEVQAKRPAPDAVPEEAERPAKRPRLECLRCGAQAHVMEASAGDAFCGPVCHGLHRGHLAQVPRQAGLGKRVQTVA